MDYPDPHKPVLVLNGSYEPINITNWKRATVLLLKEKAVMLSKRVIKLVKYIKLPFSRMRVVNPTRNMIYQRDGNKCQYCGSTKGLTIDHVIPSLKVEQILGIIWWLPALVVIPKNLINYSNKRV